MNIIITETARDYINTNVVKANGVAFRLSIKKTGCSGYSYQPAVVAAINPADETLVINGVTLCIDPLWAHLLTDLHIDVIEDKKSGLKQKKLMIENKKESGRCGCGESFHVE